MKNKFLLRLLTGFFFCSSLWQIAPAQAATSENLTIFAESNMVYALTEIARNYSKEKNIVVSINFSSSFELIQNIDYGEPADIFISSHQDWIDNLKQKGVVDVYNVSNIARDRLVVVASKNNEKINNLGAANSRQNVEGVFKIADENKIPIIVGSEYTSLGRYTSDITKNMNVDKNNIYKKINEDKNSIIDFITESPSYLGVVLKSETKNQNDIKILAEADLEIYYQALVIAGDNMEKARDFLKYLKSDQAKKILLAKGFIVN